MSDQPTPAQRADRAIGMATQAVYEFKFARAELNQASDLVRSARSEVIAAEARRVQTANDAAEAVADLALDFLGPAHTRSFVESCADNAYARVYNATSSITAACQARDLILNHPQTGEKT